MAEPVRYFSAETAVETAPTYRALSLMALIGFGISAIYAGFVMVMVLMSFLNGKPLLLSGWSILPPVVGAIVCFIAASQIRNSEGTLAGEKLVRWGLMLALFVGLGYWAYYFAVSFAVRQQARTYAEEWLKALQEGDERRVAYLVVPPLRRRNLDMKDPDFAQSLDDVMSGRAPGEDVPRSPYLRILQTRMVRLLIQSNKDFTYQFKNVRSWNFVRGAYEVALDYTFTTLEGTFEGTIVVTGSEAPHNEYDGRQWFVDLIDADKTKLNEQNEVILTPAGIDLAQVQQGAGTITALLRDFFERPDRLELFLLTIPQGKERDAARAELSRERELAAVAGPAGQLTASSDLSRRFADFLEGKLVRVESERIASEETRAKLLAGVRRFFSQPDAKIRFEVPPVMPRRRIEGDRLILRFDQTMTEMNGIFTEGYVEIEGDARALSSKDIKPNWRLRGIQLLTSKKHTMRAPTPGMQ